MKQFSKQMMILGLCLNAACGSWVGNGKKDDEKKDEGNSGNGATLLAGGVLYHKVQLSSGATLTSSYKSSSASLRLLADEQPFEVSILKADGQEVAYQRDGLEGLEVSQEVSEAGTYTVVIKNNGSESITLEQDSVAGVDEDKGLSGALDDADAVFKEYSLKAVVALGRECKQYADGGNSTSVRTAPDGEFFVQPFVFLAKVDLNTRKVERVSGADIRVVSGDRSMPLKMLSDFDLSVFRESGSLTKDEHVAYTRSFYQGYFGAAGEFYTVDTFRFGGDCAAMPTFPMDSDLGLSDLQLKVTAADLGIDETIALRPTASTAFTMYESADVKLDNWDPCTYDAFTAEPINYNFPEKTCRELSVSNPPYVTLADQMPSESNPDVYTKESDPTRILYYGHSLSRSFKEAVLENQAALRDGSLTGIQLDRCLNNGGIQSVAIGSEASYLPLDEFNAKNGDLIQLAFKTGSYTSLTRFYQGNADVSGSIQYPACIPNSEAQTSCDDYKVLTVEIENCSVKADSGVFVTSLQDSFIYPEYYGLTGSVKE